MKKILCFCVMLCYLSASPQNGSCQDINKFSQEQVQIILYAYRYGEPYKLGYTLAAIAWQESCAGLYRVNLNDPSAGLYHAYLPNVIKRHYKQKDTPFRRNVVAERLIRDIEFASQVAIEDLLYWQNIRKNNWKEMIKSYNKGFSWEKDEERNKLAEAYHQEILKKIAQIKDFIASNSHLLKPSNTLNANNLKIQKEVKKLKKDPRNLEAFHKQAKEQTLEEILRLPKGKPNSLSTSQKQTIYTYPQSQKNQQYQLLKEK